MSTSDCIQQHISNSSSTVLANSNNKVIKIPVDKLFNIKIESLSSKPQLQQLLLDLRNKYVLYLLRTINSTPLQNLKKEDNEVFSSYVECICYETEKLIEDLDNEEFFEGEYCTITKRKEEEENLQSKSTTVVQPGDEVFLNHNENMEEEEEEDEDMEEEESSTQQQQNSVSPSIDLSQVLLSIPQQQQTETSNSIQKPRSTTENNNTNQIENPDIIDNPTLETVTNTIKTQQVMSQMDSSEPIKNGSLCFNTHHHIVVGKVNSNLLRENKLHCTIMKKSTLTIFAQRRSRSGKIMKREKRAKNVIRFSKMNIDFNLLVNSFLQKQILSNVQIKNKI
ncbi:hypothetical protein ABK040_013747 [Willaertia magna]